MIERIIEKDDLAGLAWVEATETDGSKVHKVQILGKVAIKCANEDDAMNLFYSLGNTAFTPELI